MTTIYLYVKDSRIVNNKEYFTVVKSIGNNLRIAVDRAEQYAKTKGWKVPGGYFIASSKPYNFKTNYTVIETPRGFRLKPKKMDRVDMIIAYEQGDLSDDDSLKLFSDLVKSGDAWKLQGHYGRTASNLIKMGYLDKNGRILKK